MLQLQSYVQRLMSPITRQVRGMVLRGVVKVVNDSLKCQGIQVALTSDRVSDEVERFEDYGLTSHPFTEAEVLCVSVGGNAGHRIVTHVNDRRHRPKSMDEGDVCLYTDKGERVYLDSSADVVRLGDKAAAEALLLGTKFRTQQVTLNTALQTLFTALSTGWSAMSTGWAAVATFGAAAAADAGLIAVAPATATAAGIMGTAAGVAATAASAAASACATGSSAVASFESAASPDNYLSGKAATIA